MFNKVILAMLVAVFVVTGTSSVAWAAQLDARINPNTEESDFKVNYQRTVFLEYPDGGQLYDMLYNKSWIVTGSADLSNPGVQDLMEKFNQRILSDGSHARVSDLNVFYEFQLTGRAPSASFDYKVIVEGTLTDYVITTDGQRTLVDLGWRGLSTTDSIIIDGIDINIPFNVIQSQEPELYNLLQGTEAEQVLSLNLINADFILEQPLTNWHFLFDPTGVNVDAGTFGLSDSIAGFVISSWTMGESSIREGRQVEVVHNADIVLDQNYSIRSVQSSDQANLYAIGFGALDVLDGLEIAGVTPTPPEGYQTTSTGDFPVLIIYGMAGVAAIGGVAFFAYSNRALKNQKTEQQGISPDDLVGYQTSSSSGGYQTNRGEAQLKNSSDYAQTRSVYEGGQVDATSIPDSAQIDATCSCATSLSMNLECDCAMQGSCLCDSTCQCNSQTCIDYVSSMRE